MLPYVGANPEGQDMATHFFFSRGIEQGNLINAQKSLTLGEKYGTSEDTTSIRFLTCLVEPLITEKYLSSSHGAFRYQVGIDLTPDDFSPNPSPRLPSYRANVEHYRYIYDCLLLAPRCERMFCWTLGSKLATVWLSMVCLATTVSLKHHGLARVLIEKDANAADKTALACAFD
ncbi:hypothetical protein GGR58DRAFT_107754 [Xylaria digitata]|nr:hypothetical protein GGR58DRAFT_107754 [Xylaria digitata]